MYIYLNKIIDLLKKIYPVLGFKTIKSAERTIAGMEIMHMFHKG